MSVDSALYEVVNDGLNESSDKEHCLSFGCRQCIYMSCNKSDKSMCAVVRCGAHSVLFYAHVSNNKSYKSNR